VPKPQKKMFFKFYLRKYLTLMYMCSKRVGINTCQAETLNSHDQAFIGYNH